jgi:hypothetical protein
MYKVDVHSRTGINNSVENTLLYTVSSDMHKSNVL